ncbi:unnamed protein product [Mesocestoides corti]|uniref:Uncharacterized protein n=1 Tax=Mesocestoides corti TaxID=53468 RepID=A0A0R3U6L1_MESCO|nr:unnamed protein product [Mesocestoides corti]
MEKPIQRDQANRSPDLKDHEDTAYLSRSHHQTPLNVHFLKPNFLRTGPSNYLNIPPTLPSTNSKNSEVIAKLSDEMHTSMPERPPRVPLSTYDVTCVNSNLSGERILDTRVNCAEGPPSHGEGTNAISSGSPISLPFGRNADATRIHPTHCLKLY